MQPQTESLTRTIASSFLFDDQHRVRRLRVPVETVLTSTVLTGAARRLPNAELEGMIEALIGELDRRTEDADLEDDEGV